MIRSLERIFLEREDRRIQVAEWKKVEHLDREERRVFFEKLQPDPTQIVDSDCEITGGSFFGTDCEVDSVDFTMENYQKWKIYVDSEVNANYLRRFRQRKLISTYLRRLNFGTQVNFKFQSLCKIS